MLMSLHSVLYRSTSVRTHAICQNMHLETKAVCVIQHSQGNAMARTSTVEASLRVSESHRSGSLLNVVTNRCHPEPSSMLLGCRIITIGLGGFQQ